MAKKKQDGRKPCEKVETKFLPLSNQDWGLIFSVTGRTRATRILISYLAIGEGTAIAGQACEGAWSRVMEANRLFIAHQIPFRIRHRELPEEEARKYRDGYVISTRELFLETVTRIIR